MMFDPKIQTVIDKVDQLRNQVSDHWQIPRDEANLLAQIVRLGQCRSICEIGVSYGFSTLHLAAATQEVGGHIHAIDISPKKVEAAGGHLKEAGLDDCVTLHLGDAREVVPTLTPDEPFDFVFIDAVKSDSPAYLEAVTPKLASRAVLVTDNTATHRQELSDFVQTLRQLQGAKSCAVELGNGFELTIWDRKEAEGVKRS